MALISKDLQRKIGGIVSFVSLIVSVAVTVFYTPYMIENVGTRNYGIYSFVFSIVNYLDVFTSALASGYIRFSLLKKSEDPNNGEKKVNSIFLHLYIVVSAIVCVVGLILWVLFKTQTIKLDNYSAEEKELTNQIILISVICLSARIPFIVFQSDIYYKEKYIFANSVPLIGKILTTLASLAYLCLSNSKNILIIALIQYSWTLISVFLETSYSFPHLQINFCSRSERITHKKEISHTTNEILVFSFFILVNSIVDILNNDVGKTVLGFIDPHKVTIFSLVSGFNVYLLSISSFIAVLFQTEAADSALNEPDGIHMNNVFCKAGKVIMLLMFFIVGGFASSGKDFCFAWLAKNQEISSSEVMSIYYYSCIFLVSSIWPNATYLSITIRRAKNLHKIPAIFYFSAAIINVLFCVLSVGFLPSDYMVLGCVLSACISTFVIKWIVLPIYDTKKVGLHMRPLVVVFLRDLLMTIVCVSAVYLFSLLLAKTVPSHWIRFLIEALLFTFFFLAFCLVFERQTIKNMLVDIEKKKSHK